MSTLRGLQAYRPAPPTYESVAALASSSDDLSQATAAQQPAPAWPPAPAVPPNNSGWSPLYVLGTAKLREFFGHIFKTFEAHAIDPSDVGQRQIGDCFLMSSLMSLAQQDPQAIERLIRDNGDGSYEVQLFSTNDESWHRYHITQTDLAERLADGRTRAAGGDADGKGRQEMWVRVIEAAYFKEHHMDGGWAAHAMTALTGVRADKLVIPAPHSDFERLRFNATAGRIQDALAHHQPVVFESAAGIGGANGRPSNTYNIIESHAYQVESMRQEAGTGRWIVKLANPWYGREQRHQPKTPSTNPDKGLKQWQGGGSLALGEIYLDDAAKNGFISHVSVGRVPDAA